MTKKQNTIVFMICATLANVVLLALITALLLFVAIMVFKNNETFLGQAIPFILIISIVISMIIYNKLVTVIVKKFNLEDKLEPIFGKKKR